MLEAGSHQPGNMKRNSRPSFAGVSDFCRSSVRAGSDAERSLRCRGRPARIADQTAVEVDRAFRFVPRRDDGGCPCQPVLGPAQANTISERLVSSTGNATKSAIRLTNQIEWRVEARSLQSGARTIRWSAQGAE